MRLDRVKNESAVSVGHRVTGEALGVCVRFLLRLVLVRLSKVVLAMGVEGWVTLNLIKIHLGVHFFLMGFLR